MNEPILGHFFAAMNHCAIVFFSFCSRCFLFSAVRVLVSLSAVKTDTDLLNDLHVSSRYEIQYFWSLIPVTFPFLFLTQVQNPSSRSFQTSPSWPQRFIQWLQHISDRDTLAPTNQRWQRGTQIFFKVCWVYFAHFVSLYLLLSLCQKTKQKKKQLLLSPKVPNLFGQIIFILFCFLFCSVCRVYSC